MFISKRRLRPLLWHFSLVKGKEPWLVAKSLTSAICWQYELGKIANFCEFLISVQGSLWDLKTLYINFKELYKC